MASKRRIRRNHCGDKHQYDTPEAARKGAIDLWVSHGKNERILNVYPCLWEPHYHIGHKPKVAMTKKVKAQVKPAAAVKRKPAIKTPSAPKEKAKSRLKENDWYASLLESKYGDNADVV
jgi:hypothetical protein